jgi:hypothetical protein
MMENLQGPAGEAEIIFVYSAKKSSQADRRHGGHMLSWIYGCKEAGDRLIIAKEPGKIGLYPK